MSTIDPTVVKAVLRPDPGLVPTLAARLGEDEADALPDLDDRRPDFTGAISELLATTRATADAPARV
ncbi:hypothetical protein [Streptomyces sp. SID3343]|uniref:hypothetical protein n=1 Tax=Streptomyces sp. SID3343 TaxID=2690260 RepID=UPI00136F2DE6|nr:hypothetical protein [Streptomyces sp. SID3343]MYW06090.1 hypothetical protein [Streptomyces sp. SID3343]